MFYIDVFFSNLIALLPFLKITFLVTGGSLLFSVILGALSAWGTLGKNIIGKILSGLYINLMRCVPPIVLLFVVYYGAPLLFSGSSLNLNKIDASLYAIFSLSLLHGASMSEMMRGAYLSINKGQTEAALSIGMSGWQAFIRIIFPQAFKVAIPILGNTIVAMFKDGALAYSIGVVDVTGRATYIISMNRGNYVLETYLALAIIYWILSIITQKIFSILSKKNEKKSHYADKKDKKAEKKILIVEKIFGRTRRSINEA